ncbi:MAG: serine--tRNA ligase [Vicingaceae bacterium]|nr:MAG: serine--tRNA ligase [Vicingaceae bacterium]
MLVLQQIRNNPEIAINGLNKRNLNGKSLIENLLSLDEEKRHIQHELETSQAEINHLAKEIGRLMKEGQTEQAEILKTQSNVIKEKLHQIKINLENKEEQLKQLLYQIPNIPHESVPPGKDSGDNLIVYQEGELRTRPSRPHWELAKEYGWIDFEAGAKITGAGFPVYKGKGAKLQRALIQFFLDEAIKAGFEEVIPPHLVNEDSGFGTGQLPDKEGQMYHVTLDNLYLIPTAEVPITNLYRDTILRPDQFPVKNVGYTPCFRREAGSYGKDVRGLNRLHQFDKVEIVIIEHPEKSYDTLEYMVEYVKGLLRKLELPFRVALLCGGDLGFASAKTYDMEVHSPAQDKWLEVSSISNFETFQSNRMKLRFKDLDGKNKLAHTLNGSALALPRIVAGLIENHQTPDGVLIPEALRPYTGFDILN